MQYVQIHVKYRLCLQHVNPYQTTETAVTKVLGDILLALDDGNISMLTLLDLSAAFDTDDHDILLRRLEVSYGLGGAVLSWFRS